MSQGLIGVCVVLPPHLGFGESHISALTHSSIRQARRKPMLLENQTSLVLKTCIAPPSAIGDYHEHQYRLSIEPISAIEPVQQTTLIRHIEVY